MIAFSSSVMTRVDASNTADAGMGIGSGGASSISSSSVSVSTESSDSDTDAAAATGAGAAAALAAASILRVVVFAALLTTLRSATMATMAIAAAYAGVAYSMEHANSAPERNQETTMRSTVSVTAATVLNGL